MTLGGVGGHSAQSSLVSAAVLSFLVCSSLQCTCCSWEEQETPSHFPVGMTLGLGAAPRVTGRAEERVPESSTSGDTCSAESK